MGARSRNTDQRSATVSSRSSMRFLERGLLPTTQVDVEFVGERPIRLRLLDRKARQHAIAGALVGDGVEDRVELEQRVAREVHLRDESLRECLTQQREVNVGWAPRVVVVAPRIRPRLDRGEAVATFVVSQATPGS